MARIRNRKKFLALGIAAVAALGLVGTVSATAASADGNTQGSDSQGTADGRVILAQPFAKVVGVDGPSTITPAGGSTLLEGPSFGPNGQLYFVDLSAAAGEPKVLELNVQTKKVTPVHTDSTSSLASLTFSPADGKAYMTDLFNGDIYSMNPDGSDFKTAVAGPILGRTGEIDDISFDPQGNFYVSDTAGSLFNKVGRVIRFDKNLQNPTVLADGLAGANGIAFSPDFSSLWIGEFNAGNELHLSLSADRTSVTAAAVGMQANIGAGGFDSNTIDAGGNVYQCLAGDGKILVWNSVGDLLATVRIPQNLPQSELLSTNLAIKPGTTTAYVTVGGGNGGYIYTFQALAKGIAQSNGGTA
jgi:lactonase